MRTMQPSVTIGSYTWAQDRLPADEFELRLAELRAAMESRAQVLEESRVELRHRAELVPEWGGPDSRRWPQNRSR